MTYTVLNARVKQKLATEADWLAEEDTFGVIFEGEQAFVYNEAGQPVNFKIGDGTKKFSELPYFIAYYTGVTSQKILSYLDRNANITIPLVFKNNTLFQDLIFLNNSGSDIDLKIGITDGGSEIAEITVPNGVVTIGLKKMFQSAQTLYFTGLTGVNFGMFLLYFQLDEGAAIPPTSTSGGGWFVYGTIYPFYPMYDGHENDVWDFAEGSGKTGTPYSGCLLMGDSGLDDFSDCYLKGYKIGETIGGNTGNATSEVILVEDNIPQHIHKAFSGAIQSGNLNVAGPDAVAAWSSNHTSGNQDYDIKNSVDQIATMGNTSSFGKRSPTPVSLKPKSKIVLFFTGAPTT